MRHILLAAAAMTLASCSNDIEPAGGERLPDGKYPLNITATVEGMTSRAAGERTAFQTGDAIGVRIGDNAATGEYIMNESSSLDAATPLYWQTSAETAVTAWYPCKLTEVSLTNQSKDFTPVDFLQATRTASYRDNPLSLTFTHRMAKVRYELRNEAGITDADWENVTVKIYGYTTVTSDAAGNLSGSAEDWIVPGSTETWLMPQDMTGRQFIRVSATIDGQSKTFAYTPATTDDGNITPGCIHTYTITVKRDRIEVKMVKGGGWIDSGDENIGSKEVRATYTADQLKPGDYFYRKEDGNWATSDGGLRAIYGNGTIKVENTPVDPAKGTCIGIVFRAEHNANDASDYTQQIAANTKKLSGDVHGYVVALTDADCDGKGWERNPYGKWGMLIGTSTSETDWNGYGNNCMIYQKAISTQGYGVSNWPAYEACVEYGTKDWHQNLYSPDDTSLWYLPSSGQFSEILKIEKLIEQNINNVKQSASDAVYKDRLSWIDYNNTKYFVYWMSNEYLSGTATAAWGYLTSTHTLIGLEKEQFSNESGESRARCILTF